MKFLPIIASSLGVVSFAFGAEQTNDEPNAVMVEAIIEGVNLDQEPDAAVVDSIIRSLTLKRAEAAEAAEAAAQRAPKPTRDLSRCNDFGLWKCGYHCVTQVLAHIPTCVAANDVHCLCYHQKEITHDAAYCVWKSCGKSKKKAREFLWEAQENCNRYKSCSKHAPMATAVHVSGINNKAMATAAFARPTFYPVQSKWKTCKAGEGKCPKKTKGRSASLSNPTTTWGQAPEPTKN